MSNQVTSVCVSASVAIGPIDDRCRYWAKIVRAEEELPLPSNVSGASDIRSAYVKNGDEELFPGDILIEGEEVNHRKNRGWSYWITYCDSNGLLHRIQNPGTAEKKAMKAAGLPSELLPGSGEVAAAVRYAHGVRLGLVEANLADSQ